MACSLSPHSTSQPWQMAPSLPTHHHHAMRHLCPLLSGHHQSIQPFPSLHTTTMHGMPPLTLATTMACSPSPRSHHTTTIHGMPPLPSPHTCSHHGLQPLPSPHTYTMHCMPCMPLTPPLLSSPLTLATTMACSLFPLFTPPPWPAASSLSLHHYHGMQPLPSPHMPCHGAPRSPPPRHTTMACNPFLLLHHHKGIQTLSSPHVTTKACSPSLPPHLHCSMQPLPSRHHFTVYGRHKAPPVPTRNEY